MIKVFTNILFFILVQTVFGQSDTILLTKNFKFNDGVYLNFEEFKANRPHFLLNNLTGNIFTNPQTFITQVESLEVKDKSEKIDIENIWGLSIDGIPYVKFDKEDLDLKLTTFVGLKVRGKICYFSYKKQIEEQIVMPVYNPLTGRPFRSMAIKREKDLTIEKIMLFDDGKIIPFDYDNFTEIIADDKGLLTSVENTDENEVMSKLFKCLLIYNDRNAVYVSNKTIATEEE